MKQPLNPAAVHKEYEEGMTSFRRMIPDSSVRALFTQEADRFMRSCACGVWNTDQGLTPMHVEYYNAVYCRGNPVPTVLYWELVSEVSGYSGFVLPEFFHQMVRSDVERGKNLSRRFIDTFTLMLLLFAAADGAVSEEEGAFVTSCVKSMTAFCDQSGVKERKSEYDVQDFVTRNAAAEGESPVQSEKAPEEIRTPSEEGQSSEPEREPEPSLEELLSELDSLCGLNQVKEDVKSLINLVKVNGLRKDAGLPVPPLSLHLVFLGNPGTGKTTVARLLAKIYHAIGVLPKGQLTEVDRSGLVAGFVGQTALKTQEVIDKALGGVLFIDEAYSLVNQDAPNDFGTEAIEVLLKGMEDHRDDLIVIVAGYTDLMERFIHSNPGLESRFNKYFFFEDYNGDQLTEIFYSFCEKNGYTVEEETGEKISAVFHEMYESKDENFGNARDVRNFFEQAVARQANRVAVMDSPGREDLMALTEEDFGLAEQPD